MRYATIGSDPLSARKIGVLGTVGDDTLPRPPGSRRRA